MTTEIGGTLLRGVDAAPLKVAVVGSGISGLGASMLLASRHRVTLFEANAALGGHARTLDAGRDEKYAVDTGFIVFNDRNYPLLNEMFRALDVPSIKSDMSFGASLDNGAFEYSTQSLSALMGDRRNVMCRNYWRMLRDILKFNSGARAALLKEPDASLGELLDAMRMGTWFRERYLLPMSGAIWSTSTSDMLAFPARAFITFFDNHGLLTVNDHPQWYTVKGGSREYVQRLTNRLADRGVDIRTGTPIESVTRADTGVWVRAKSCEPEGFDTVVMACHADQSLKLLSDADQEEKACLSALRYRANRAVLHDYAHCMPRRKACWASWIFTGHTNHSHADMSLTYWMNRLQSIPDKTPLFVTLNPIETIPDHHIFDETTFYHPQFDHKAIAAQQTLEAINGRRGIWFCGAYARNGFHEDGLWSGVRVAKALGADVTWT